MNKILSKLKAAFLTSYLYIDATSLKRSSIPGWFDFNSYSQAPLDVLIKNVWATRAIRVCMYVGMVYAFCQLTLQLHYIGLLSVKDAPMFAMVMSCVFFVFMVNQERTKLKSLKGVKA